MLGWSLRRKRRFGPTLLDKMLWKSSQYFVAFAFSLGHVRLCTLPAEKPRASCLARFWKHFAKWRGRVNRLQYFVALAFAINTTIRYWSHTLKNGVRWLYFKKITIFSKKFFLQNNRPLRLVSSHKNFVKILSLCLLLSFWWAGIICVLLQRLCCPSQVGLPYPTQRKILVRRGMLYV